MAAHTHYHSCSSVIPATWEAEVQSQQVQHSNTGNRKGLVLKKKNLQYIKLSLLKMTMYLSLFSWLAQTGHCLLLNITTYRIPKWPPWMTQSLSLMLNSAGISYDGGSPLFNYIPTPEATESKMVEWLGMGAWTCSPRRDWDSGGRRSFSLEFETPIPKQTNKVR